MSKKRQSTSCEGIWRYQAVRSEKTNALGGRYNSYSICEIYLDEDGRLEAWTKSSSIAPDGETVDELRRDLEMMLSDISKWKPVSFDSQQIGMLFERI